jgi:hypothetical protein
MAFKVVTAEVTVTTAGTAVALGSVKVPFVTILALPANAGEVYVGQSTVSSTDGFTLEAGKGLSLNDPDPTTTGDKYDLSEIYVDSANNGDKVRIIYAAVA